MTRKLVQIRDPGLGRRVGLVEDEHVYDLTAASSEIASSTLSLIRHAGPSLPKLIEDLAERLPSHPLWRYADLDRAPGPGAHLVSPLDPPEIWAAGLTYERSRDAREVESEGAALFYTRAYNAPRPELFIKTSNMLRVAGPHEPIGIRRDSIWTVPEPELGVVIGPDGEVIAYTIGNDVTARDIEAENPLYLPQAKTFRGCCSFGPALLIAEEAVDPRAWEIRLRVDAGGGLAFSGAISVSRMRRSAEDLASFLCRDNEILAGTLLLTGTGIVPEDDFSLKGGQVVEISIDPIGTLSNPVVELV